MSRESAGPSAGIRQFAAIYFQKYRSEIILTMFTRLQAHHFRSLKIVDQPLGRFQALVGPNASGKTTFLDLLVLLSDLMRFRGDVPEAVGNRSADFSKLLWKGGRVVIPDRR